ncbi:keratin, type I cytoskeletal 19-like [Hyla sarda]|uniref:keratin, type I cytoskeletal 19-like n=1 Tax=Hyla sarda TaxID=327740 RepID=UPI0024C2C943|nr:keratin, type I cytoskeletal 19-like [Hyla sarda]
MSHNSKPGKFKGNLSPNVLNQIASLNLRGFSKATTATSWRPISFRAKPPQSPIIKHKSFTHGSTLAKTHERFIRDSSPSRDFQKQLLLTSNEKETMRTLNDRLASYLEKVRSLEEENAHMEKKIREWYDKNHPQMLPDFNDFFGEIEELQRKIFKTTMENKRLSRQVGNTRLAVEDFQNKYELEVNLRTDIEQDVKTLRFELEAIKEEVDDLDFHHQELQEDMLQKKKSNHDTINSLYNQLGARVTVEVDTPQTVNLSKLLTEIRDQYEELMENNKAEAEKWFLAKTEKLKCDVESGSSDHLPTYQGEIIELKRMVQTMDIDLQSQLSMKMALETTLAEKEASYSSQLSQIQELINQVEANLSQIRDKQEWQNEDYKTLMDVTTHLEREISTYRLLLDDQDTHPTESLPPVAKSHHKVTMKTHFYRSKLIRVLSVTEEIEHRKIVSPKGTY